MYAALQMEQVLHYMQLLQFWCFVCFVLVGVEMLQMIQGGMVYHSQQEGQETH